MQMKQGWIVCATVAAVGAAAWLADAAAIGDKTGGKDVIPAKIDPPKDFDLKQRATTVAVDKLRAAYELIDAGAKAKNAVLLCAAAELLASLQPAKFDGDIKKPSGKSDPFETPEQLLALALKFGGNAPYVKDMVDATRKRIADKNRDLSNPIQDSGELPPGEKAFYHRNAVAGTITHCTVRTDLPAALEAAAYQDGKLLSYDRSPELTAFLRFSTPQAGQTTVVIHNTGSVKVRYTISSN